MTICEQTTYSHICSQRTQPMHGLHHSIKRTIYLHVYITVIDSGWGIEENRYTNTYIYGNINY